ncbi:MAG: T9SS type A sorting domain-containing protein [Bacteroidota bacterium]
MKKHILLFTILLTIFGKASLYAQCTPNVAINDTIQNPNRSPLFPPLLPFATANLWYSQAITFKVPLDSNIVVGGYSTHAHIDSAAVIKIYGIPKGYWYECNRNNCTWPGGTLGCALLSGTGDSSMVNTYNLLICVETYTHIGVIPPLTPYNRIDTSSYSFKILPTGIFELETVKHLKAYPNPVNDILTIELTGIDGKDNTVEVFDATGRIVFTKKIDKPTYFAATEKVDLSELSKGLYSVVLRSDKNVYLKKVMHN